MEKTTKIVIGVGVGLVISIALILFLFSQSKSASECQKWYDSIIAEKNRIINRPEDEPMNYTEGREVIKQAEDFNRECATNDEFS